MNHNEKCDVRESPLAMESERFLKEAVGGAMDGYEIRPSQLEMMKACSRNMEEGGTLMAEAGTGTGKTFAYLIPLIISGKKAVVSTKTINLQEQLASKDLRFLSGLKEFSYAIAKGRGNYLCLRRFNAFRVEDERDATEYRMLHMWVSTTDTGDLEDLDVKRSFIWDKVCSDSDACKGLKCGYYSQCFYFRARKSWEMAQIVVANHALIGINSMLHEHSRMLPQAEVLVIDEAHALDNVLSDVIGITLSNRGFGNILSRLLRLDDRGTYKGLLSGAPHLFDPVTSLGSEMELLWLLLKKEFRDRDTIKGDFKFSDLVTGLSDSIRTLITEIRTSVTGLFKEDEEIELGATLLKLKAFSDGLEGFAHEMDDYVRWIEREGGRTALRMAPIYPRDFVIQQIVPDYQSIILTSATLSVSGDFRLMSQVLGLKEAETMSLPSPFDLKKQVTIETKKGIDLKTDNGAEKLAEVIVEEAARKDGGMLVLFTSREVMKKTWGLCSEKLGDMDLNPMMQGELSRRRMLEAMRESENSLIFGLDSFWEGVDVRGDSLKCLVITKLPFEVPTEPIVMARTEMIEREGGNPFYEYTLPRAVLKFKQGFGRLIRSKTDTGRILICDERIETKKYGRVFKEVL
ncbi:MAG: ATP-dependent DNA helicase [Nitrospirae bacterium]|nr:ATP-dependent DNA helicase [Nitrospirota bacterium]